MPPQLRVAYLVNQYPMVSLAFIRREIQALETLGVEVVRFSIRRWDGTLVDSADIQEQRATRYVLDRSVFGLLASFALFAAVRPVRFLRGLRMALSLGAKSERGRLWYLAYLVEAVTLVRWLQRAGVQHLHAHFCSNPAAVALLCRTLGGPPYSFTVHGPHEFDVAATQCLEEKTRGAAFVVAISHYCRSQLCRWAAWTDWQKIVPVRCGVDESYLAPPPQAEDCQSFVCVGRLCEQKAQLLLVDAFAEVVRRHPRARLVLVGDGEMRRAIEQRIADEQLDDKVEITGWRDSQGVLDALVRARALVLPSFAEGLPVVIMEALALGRPVISTYIAGIPELVEPGKNGWLVPASDRDGLVSAMCDCLEQSPETLQRMGEYGRAAVLSRHDAAQEAERLAGWIRRSASGSLTW